MQQILPLNSCGFAAVVNSGAAESRGFELEVQAAATDSLLLSLAVGLTDTEVTDNGGIDQIGEGNPIEMVPEWTITASADYDFSIAGFPAFARLDYSYIDESISRNNDPVNPRMRDAYSIANLNLGVDIENISLSLFVDNISNENANLSDLPPLAIEMPGRPRLVTNRRRTIGANIMLSF